MPKAKKHRIDGIATKDPAHTIAGNHPLGQDAHNAFYPGLTTDSL
jgi:hypothetical protein